MKWNPGKLLSGRGLRSFVFCALFFILTVSGSCALPGDGWFERQENNSADLLFELQKNQQNTKLLAENTEDEQKKADWRKRYDAIPVPGQAPADQNPGNWVETLLYILLGMSGLGGVAKGAHFLYKIPPKERPA